MYKIGICDDEEKQRNHIKEMLTGLSFESNLEFSIEAFSSGEELLAAYEKGQASFHILLLDVEMGGINGIETAKRIRELKHLDEQIIFLTSYPQYMMDSFDVITYQYLLKPVEEEVFKEKIAGLCSYLSAQEKKFLIVKSGLEEVLLKYDDIVAIEVVKSLTVKNKLKIITTTQSYETKGTIAKYAQILNGSTFLQIHRGIIINFIHVKKFFQNNVLMLNGAEFPIGRSKIKEVKDQYTKFMITEGS